MFGLENQIVFSDLLNEYNKLLAFRKLNSADMSYITHSTFHILYFKNKNKRIVDNTRPLQDLQQQQKKKKSGIVYNNIQCNQNLLHVTIISNRYKQDLS